MDVKTSFVSQAYANARSAAAPGSAPAGTDRQANGEDASTAATASGEERAHPQVGPRGAETTPRGLGYRSGHV